MKSKHYIRIFYFVVFFFWAAMYSHVFILSSYAADLGATATFIGVITGSYGFMQLLLRLPLGIASDRLHRRKIFISGAFVASLISGIVMYFVPTPVGLLMGRILCGISACAYVQIIILFTSYFDDEEMPRAVGSMSFVTNASQLGSMLIAGWVSQQIGKPSTFLLTILFAGVGLVLSRLIYEHKVDRPPISLREVRGVFSQHNLIIAIILAILCQFLAFGKSWAFVPLAAAQLGASTLTQSFLTSIYTLMGAIAALISGRLAHTHNMKRYIIGGLLFHAAGSLILPVYGSITGLFISQILSGIGNGIVITLVMSMGLLGIPAHQRGTAMGLYQALYAIGMVAGPVVVGALADTVSLSFGFTVTGILAFVGILISVFLVQKHRLLQAVQMGK